tara:strand:+ start:2238 stop:2813 length:576 start_codon:yes stop_codon:yes gene_type:complete
MNSTQLISFSIPLLITSVFLIIIFLNYDNTIKTGKNIHHNIKKNIPFLSNNYQIFIVNFLIIPIISYITYFIESLLYKNINDKNNNNISDNNTNFDINYFKFGVVISGLFLILFKFFIIYYLKCFYDLQTNLMSFFIISLFSIPSIINILNFNIFINNNNTKNNVGYGYVNLNQGYKLFLFSSLFSFLNNK